MSKVVQLTSVHPRDDIRIFFKECRALVSVGHDVTLVVADGKGDAVRDGVTIVDVGKPVGRRDRMLRIVRLVSLEARLLSADVYHLHDPELLRIAVSLGRANEGRARVVFDAHEDLPRQILSKVWIPKPLRRLVSWAAECVENHVVRRLDGVVAATPQIASRFKRISPHTVNINNYPLPGELAPPQVACMRQQQICYVGGITRVRGLKALIEALPLVPDATLVLCGEIFESDLDAELRALPGWTQVDYRGHVDRTSLQQIMSACVAGVVTFLPVPNHINAQPNKMFEYMSAELPVIASNFPLWRQIIDGAHAGLCVDPRSPEAIAGAIRRLLADPALVERMGKAGRKAVLEKYNWPNEATKLIEFYEGLS